MKGSPSLLLPEIRTWFTWAGLKLLAAVLNAAVLVPFAMMFAIGPFMLPYVAVLGLLAGLLVGVVEWFAARRHFAATGRWIWVTGLGNALGWSLFAVLPVLAMDWTLFAFAVALCGVSVGILQWALLRRQLPLPALWAAGPLVGWTLGILGIRWFSTQVDADSNLPVALIAAWASLIAALPAARARYGSGHRLAIVAKLAAACILIGLGGFLYFRSGLSQQTVGWHGHRGDYNPVNAVAFSGDGTLLATGGEAGDLHVWENPGWAIRFSAATVNKISDSFGATRYEGGGLTALAFSPDDSVLAAGTSDGTLHVWDAQSGTELWSGRAGNAYDPRGVADIDFSPDGSLLAIATGRPRTVKIWDVKARSTLWVLDLGEGYLDSVEFSPDGKLLAAGGSGPSGAAVVVWDFPAGKEKFSADLAGSSAHVAFSPDSTLLAAGLDSLDWDTELEEFVVMDVLTGEKLQAGHGSGVRCITFSPDGAVLAMGRGRESGLLLWDMAGDQELRVLRGGNTISSIAYSPDGRMLLTGSLDGWLRLWPAVRSP